MVLRSLEKLRVWVVFVDSRGKDEGVEGNGFVRIGVLCKGIRFSSDYFLLEGLECIFFIKVLRNVCENSMGIV